jgi:hypothetical protein
MKSKRSHPATKTKHVNEADKLLMERRLSTVISTKIVVGYKEGIFDGTKKFQVDRVIY